MKAFLTRTPVLWGLFIAQFVMGFSFYLIMQAYDFQLIDKMSVPGEISAHIAAMSETQRRIHIWVTATLDVAYPITYGSFFAAMAWRFLGRAGTFLALPGLIVILIDLSEGVVQIMALGGNESLLWLKAFLTPAKFGLFMIAAMIALGALCVAIWRLVRTRKDTPAT